VSRGACVGPPLCYNPGMTTHDDSSGAPLTFMAVHAHPDDEVVFGGGLWPLYHARGIRTVLVCCTNGSEGEIHDPDLHPENDHPRLAEIRAGELRCAAEKLQISALEMLGYADSGMAGTAANANPECFSARPREETTARLVALVRRYRPQVLLTYNDYGAYGHPDHIAAHQITMAAYDAAADPAYHPELGAPWAPLKLYYAAWNEDGFKQAREMYLERGLKWPWDREDEAKPEAGASEEEVAAEAAEAQEAAPKEREYQPPPVTTRVDVRATTAQRLAAIRCHRTQFSADGLMMAIPPDIAEVAFGIDCFTLARARVAAPAAETDLFAGLA
jgi:LmbE family N-acetylglucosaminyl deacetylase